ncbi:DUF6625 family protein [Pontibacter beigongshangensis]|uniref:DUF6625 family protein n=1 Tax=Pontibacter beigongshangensis TaxID=2574733 RepID=UPI001650AC6E|nr:DUF6625 family protein [Pontibacter beigongshangensis]
MQKSIVFIIPHFGKFKSYFQLWLQSCKYNPSIHWLIFTDDHTSYDFPPNVIVHYTTFEETVSQIQEVFDFEICLKSPYYLCEFKVAYGEIYQKYIEGYDFWGFCDTDLIWGNLREHITDEILTSYSKISWRGHLTLFRNNKHINSLYKSTIDGIEFYKFALSNQSGHFLWFDERVINYIFESKNESIYTDLMFADLKIRSYNFFLLHFLPENDFKNNSQIFLWEKGNLFRLYSQNNKVYKESFAYIHFLKREMKIVDKLKFEDRFLIVPNKFINYIRNIDADKIDVLSKKRYYWEYVFSRLNSKYVKNKINYFLNKRAFKKHYSFLPVNSYHCKVPTPVDVIEYNN